ncbi:hypothetical protein ACIPWY_11145 [Streptomyces sp. NPDC090032]|uniref:hypothetical protein n=1 Tax=unclassified Streptomyces TaxID=2593676 RepID=UPI00371F7582
MESDLTPDRSSGLSTEDLVQTSDRSDRSQDETVEDRTETPAFPGESTAIPSTEHDEAEEEETGAEGEETGRDVPAEEEVTRLLSTEDEEGFRSRWEETQSKFVDDPRDAVHSADALVADVMQTLAATFAERKKELEEQWSRGERADTEDLRVALRHYRSFFNRLLTA